MMLAKPRGRALVARNKRLCLSEYWRRVPGHEDGVLEKAAISKTTRGSVYRSEPCPPTRRCAVQAHGLSGLCAGQPMTQNLNPELRGHTFSHYRV